MTIICAAHIGGETWIGADSLGAAGELICPEYIEKIARQGRWHIGVAGTAYSTILIRRKAGIIAGLTDPYDVGEALMDLWKEHGYKAHETCDSPCYGQECVIASPDGVWNVTQAGTVLPPRWGFTCAGSGTEAALGAAITFRDGVSGAHPQEMVEAALRAACEVRTDCGGELVIRKVCG